MVIANMFGTFVFFSHTLDKKMSHPLPVKIRKHGEVTTRQVEEGVGSTVNVASLCDDEDDICYLDGHLATKNADARTLPREKFEKMVHHDVTSESMPHSEVVVRIDPTLFQKSKVPRISENYYNLSASAESICVRVDFPQISYTVLRKRGETLGEFLDFIKLEAGVSSHVAVNRSVGMDPKLMTWGQLSKHTLEIMRVSTPGQVQTEIHETIVAPEVVGTSRAEAAHTKDEDDRRGKALNETERRQIMHMLDLAEHNKRTAQKEGVKIPIGKKLSYRKIAELTGKHHNTIAKLKKQRETQECRRVEDSKTGMMRTVEAPVAGRQGGFRWCRLDEEQKRLCTRIAIEDPRLTTTAIRMRVQEAYPQLTTLSDSTVWRVLHDSNLQFLRAKMRDPTTEKLSHKIETDAFLKEQCPPLTFPLC